MKQTLIITGTIVLALSLYWTISETGVMPSADTKPKTNAELVQDEVAEAIVEQDVDYFEGRTGFYARPIGPGQHPGIVMVHEWWGLNDNIKEMARQLARRGYSVLAVDLHGEVAKDPARARELTQKVDKALAVRNMKSAAQFLRAEGATRLASLGWCFGGAQALQLALSGEKLDATVIYYGQLETDATKLSAISWPVLGIFGDKDTSVTPESVRAFESSLKTAGVPNEIHMYAGVGHAFANPSGTSYAEAETKDAWNKTLAFLNENLEPQTR